MAYLTSLSERSRALAALTVAGGTWGLTLPLSAIVLRHASPAWLVCTRFGLAALLLGLISRRGDLRAALRPRIVGWGILGYGCVVLLQGAAIERTSVGHVAMIGGVVPVLVVLIAIARGGEYPSRTATLGLLGAVGGVAFITGGGGHASLAGDALVLLASLCSSIYIAAQPPLLLKRNPVAVTAVQMGAASIASVPLVLLGGPTPHVHGSTLLALLGLVTVGSLLPFTLYAWSQTRVPSEVAGVFLNLEALVGALVGIAAFHDPATARQLSGMALMLSGILLVAAKASRPNGWAIQDSNLGPLPYQGTRHTG